MEEFMHLKILYLGMLWGVSPLKFGTLYFVKKLQEWKLSSKRNFILCTKNK